MKWLRSSLFKDNNDIFVFEEKLNINLENFISSLKGVEEVLLSGTFTRSSQDKIVVDLKLTGIYKIVSSRTLEIHNVPFVIEETEEFFDKSSYNYDDTYYECNVMDKFIDLSDLVNELLILNVPTSFYTEDEKVDKSIGKDWQLISNEDFVEEAKKNNPFSALSDMFKEN